MSDIGSTDRAAAKPISFAGLTDEFREVYRTGRTRPLEWRREQLDGLLRMLREHERDFVDAIRSDLGRPTAEALSADIGHATLAIRHLRKNVHRWMKPTRVFPGLMSLPGRAHSSPEPLGVALVIAPWNYPVQLLIEPMAAALSAGNCVVAKPSEMAPATASLISRLIPRFVDAEAVAVVEGGVPETTALLEQQFDHIFFTGSPTVGRIVMTAAAHHLTPVTLELGGKSPAIIASDATLDVAARRVVWGKFLNAGQTCVAPDYVLVERGVEADFVHELSRAVAAFYGSDAASSPDLARIVNDAHFVRLERLLDTCGGEVVVGGARDAARRFIAPTVVARPSLESDLMNEEIFGPILPVVPVDSVDEAVAFVTERAKPLALYVFTESEVIADQVTTEVSFGGGCVNHALMQAVPENLPFGGVGPSGMGAYHGKAGFDTFSHRKSILRKPTRPDPSVLYPPYSTLTEKVFQRAFR